MSLQLDYVSARDLARELLGRGPTILRGQVARVFRRRPALGAAGAPRVDRSAFTTFTREDGVAMPLWKGYRNRIKPRWQKMFWPARVLVHLDRMTALPPSLREVATSLREARSLPLPVKELFSLIQPIAREHPQLIVPTERHDPIVDATELAVIPTREQIQQRIASHIANARRLLGHFRRSRVPHDKLRVLEQGCGGGYTTMALASLGVGESFGIDIDFERYAGDVEWRMLHEQFLHVAKRSAAARVGVGDAMALAFSDESFDIVHSTVALEHIARPELAFREAVRVLKPGGIAYFEVGPWFGPDGGHSLCTLDCPWGHVRLNPVQFENYLAAFRPNERTTAISYYRGGFQTPRLTLAETEAMVLDSSFRILEWYESRHKYADHYQFLTPELLADCQRLNRFVTVRDLMSSSYTMLLEKL